MIAFLGNIRFFFFELLTSLSLCCKIYRERKIPLEGMMKQADWKIVYHKYEGMEKRAIELLSKDAGKYLIRDEGVYTI